MTRFAGAVLGLVALAADAVGQADDPRAVFAHRSGASKSRALKQEGGNELTESAVAKGLLWLARQQKPGGSWELAGEADPVAATGLALLPYLGAGQTHRSGGKYTKTIADGLKLLHDGQDPATGAFGAGVSPAGQALATAAVCEAAGMTADPKYQPAARAAVKRLLELQRPDGGWAEDAGTESTVAGSVWAAVALRAARASRFEVPDDAAANLARYLDARPVAADRPRTRAEFGADPPPPEPVWAFRATRARFRAGGPAWADWNEGPLADDRRAGGMREWLVRSQSAAGNDSGSWAAPAGLLGGRLAATALHLLTLEVYYRDPRPPVE